MKNKAFTLIELLAVIVILAIIALIATPIILGIINSTREEARKRSAEAVSHAVETAYIQTAMKAETNGSASLNNENVIGNTKIDNERSRTATSITTNDGVTCTLSSSFILTCTYGNDTDPLINPKDVKNGTEVVKTGPDWYSLSSSVTVGSNLPANKTDDPTTLSFDFYLGYAEDSGKVSAIYLCFIGPNDGEEYCLKDGDNHATNVSIIEDAFGSSMSSSDRLPVDGPDCDMIVTGLSAPFLTVGEYNNNGFCAGDNAFGCSISGNGSASCILQ